MSDVLSLQNCRGLSAFSMVDSFNPMECFLGYFPGDTFSVQDPLLNIHTYLRFRIQEGT